MTKDKNTTLDVQAFFNAHRFSGYQWLIFALCFLVVLLDGRLVLYVGERQLDVHATNRWAPLLVPLGLLTLLLGYGHPGGTLLFVTLFGIGNGMLTIVKGTVMAQYVSAAHVGALNGALGLPLALARAAAPLAVGLLWTPGHGYALGLALLLALSVLGVAMLWRGQTLALRTPR